MEFEEWWSQIENSKEVADTIVEVFEGIAQEAWQSSASFTRKQVVESITEFEEVLELIEDAHETSKNNTDNMAYYSWEKMWKDMKVNFDKLAAKLREGG
jgi:hypothetical protein